jgi:hypothetical protein
MSLYPTGRGDVHSVGGWVVRWLVASGWCSLGVAALGLSGIGPWALGFGVGSWELGVGNWELGWEVEVGFVSGGPAGTTTHNH